jgi:hypothetical protein
MPDHYKKALLDHIEEAPQTAKATQQLFDNWEARLNEVDGVRQWAEVEKITTTVIDETTRAFNLSRR